MLKNKDFWVGVALGVIAYHLYKTYGKKGPGA